MAEFNLFFDKSTGAEIFDIKLIKDEVKKSIIPINDYAEEESEYISAYLTLCEGKSPEEFVKLLYAEQRIGRFEEEENVASDIVLFQMQADYYVRQDEVCLWMMVIGKQRQTGFLIDLTENEKSYLKGCFHGR